MLKKGKSWTNEALIKTYKIFLNRKTNPKKRNKKLLSKNFKENILEDQKNILINAMKLCNGKNKIIKLYEDKNIKPSNFSHNAKSEPEEFETKIEESIAERTKMRRQKFDEKNRTGQGLKMLTPDQMLSRLLISLAQLKAGNNSEKLKSEIRQLLYSLYRSKKLTKMFL